MELQVMTVTENKTPTIIMFTELCKTAMKKF